MLSNKFARKALIVGVLLFAVFLCEATVKEKQGTEAERHSTSLEPSDHSSHDGSEKETIKFEIKLDDINDLFSQLESKVKDFSVLFDDVDEEIFHENILEFVAGEAEFQEAQAIFSMENFPEELPDILRGIELLEISAQKGHLEAAGDLGFIFLFGYSPLEVDDAVVFPGIRSNITKAVYYLQMAARENSLDENLAVDSHDGDFPVSPEDIEQVDAKLEESSASSSPHSSSHSTEHGAFMHLGGSDHLTQAHLALAVLYTHGFGLPQSTPKALLHFQLAEKAGSAEAAMALGYRQMHGLQVSKSCKSAFAHYFTVAHTVAMELAQDSTWDAAHYPLLEHHHTPGARLSDEDLIDEDVVDFHRAHAHQGAAQSQVFLGSLHLTGAHGIAEDHHRALEYLQEAAGQGHPAGQSLLAHMYATGTGVEQNNHTAFELYHQAALQGDTMGLFGLGYCYQHGLGVDQNYTLAREYYSKAAAKNSPDAMHNLGVLYYNGLGMAKDLPKAARWFELASARGHPVASFYYGQMLGYGLGVAENCPRAVRLLKAVAERGEWAWFFDEGVLAFDRGDYDAALASFLYLAELGYLHGQRNAEYVIRHVARLASTSSPSPTFVTTASLPLQSTPSLSTPQTLAYGNQAFIYPNTSVNTFRLLEMEAAAGHLPAILLLGDLYFYGWGVVVNYRKASSYYQTAANMGSPEGLYDIGWMHLHGVGLPQDFHLAKRYYDRAWAYPHTTLPIGIAMFMLFAYWGIDILQAAGLWEWDVLAALLLFIALFAVLLFRLIAR